MMGKGKGKLYNIWLTASETKDGKIVFAADTSLPQDHHNGIDTFTFNKKGNGMFREDFYLIQFTLEDTTTHNLRFPLDPSAALWACRAADQSNPQSSCPTAQPAVPSDQLKGLAVLNDQCLLAVNYNFVQEQVAFALNFLGDGLPTGVQWDPIGNNQNSGKY